MNKQEYIAYLEVNLESLLQEYLFINYKNQLIARKLSAAFNSSYSESYLWDKAIYLSTNGCIILDADTNRRLAIKSLKEAAEIFENLSLISEEYDRDYCLILASLCYDIAGYQANALCLTRKLNEYSFISEEPIELSSDNYIFGHVRQILLKNIYFARASINANLSDDVGVSLFNKSISSWYESVLNGTDNNFLNDFDASYRYYLNDQNIYLSQLVFLLRSRVRIYIERSIWNNLFAIDRIRENPVWTKYIKLLTYDIYDRSLIKEPTKRISKFEFWISQLRAFESGLLSTDQNFVVQMPTSAGKTFIAEIAILNALLQYPEKKCIYVAPFRALTNEKENELADYLSKLGFSVSALSGSYEIDEFQELILEETDVLIATPEKIDLLLRLNPDYFNLISLIVIDEGHIVGDISSRSSLLEFLIIRLRMRIATLRTLFISAVMPPENANEYSLWLSGAEGNVIRSKLFVDSPIDEEWEPTKKLIGRFTWVGNNGRITYKNIETENEETKNVTAAFVPAIITKLQYGNRFPDGTNKAQTSASLAFELSKDGNCLVFCAQVPNTKSVGEALLNLLILLDTEGVEIPEILNRNRTKESYFFANKWYGADSYITKCIERGIGVHFGDMPEAVRRSVESDYSAGNLRILISTNTVSQGLNFPIKYLIVHSTIINAQNGIEKVSVRDFWNLIGRAGRAGKETEGHIIFVINSKTDARSYLEYTNKENIDYAFSMFFNVLDSLADERINENTFEEFMTTLSEPYLLSVLAEEAVGTDSQTKIETIISNSLFKVQADLREMDLTPIRKSFNRIARSIQEEIPQNLIKVYSETGFCLKSNQSISTYIENNIDQLNEYLEDDNFEGILEMIFTLFSEVEIEEVASEKLGRLNTQPSAFFGIAKKWISGAEVSELQTDWIILNPRVDRFHLLLSEGFYFRYPWGITSFITILMDRLDLDSENMPVGIKNLSSYLKFGLNNPTACLARSLGIRNRDASLLLAERSNNLTGRDFIKWVANLTDEDVNGFEINTYDKQNILNTAIKLTPNRYQEIPTQFDFLIRGINFEDIRRELSKGIIIGDTLEYNREPSNPFDPYAIKLFRNENELGYIPREYSKMISVEIDINQSDYDLIVTNTVVRDAYSEIYVSMTKK